MNKDSVKTAPLQWGPKLTASTLMLLIDFRIGVTMESILMRQLLNLMVYSCIGQILTIHFQRKTLHSYNKKLAHYKKITCMGLKFTLQHVHL